MSIYDKASLVLIPSGTKTSKVYSQKPTNGDGDFTFSRSTAATRVNASGNIEKETQNLLLQSNQFDTTWANANSTETGGQSGYDGSSDAWLINKTGGSGRIYQSITLSGVQTMSIYAKAGSVDWCLMQVIGGSNPYAYFDLGAGVVGSLGGGSIDSSMESIGSGWYRCQFTFNASITEVRFSPSDANSASGTSGNAYFQDAQLEQGLVARDYIETTTTAIYGGITDNVPRLDYTDSSCPALLLEPQRTNLVTSSEYFSSIVAVTSSYVDSPEGLNNATRLTENTSTSQHYSAINVSGIISGNKYAISFYVRQGSYSSIQVYTQSSKIATTASIFFSTETISVSGAVAGSPFMTPVGNGWYRCGWVGTAIGDGNMDIYAPVVNLSSSVGDGTSYIDYYGFQVEDDGAGNGTSYATSYIPTYGSAVTRNGDDFSDNGYQSKGIFGADSGSIFLDFGTEFTIFDGVSNSSPTDLFQFVDITSYGGGYMRLRGGESNHYLQLVSMGAADNSLSFTDQTKYCICWDSNGVDFYGNGALIQSTTITNAPSFDRLERGITGNGREGRVKEVLFFPTKLSSQEAIDLTTI